MSTTSTTPPGHVAPRGDRPQEMRKVAVASCVGTTIEYYDFFIYGTAAALVFPTVFFPALGSTAGTVASFATFAVAFVARPLGAVLFGHFGDRLGRKRTLVTTLLLMGAATVAIGLLPTAAAIGVLAPIALVVLRFLQGLAVGGEWAGANLLTAEYAPVGKRGFYAVFPQLGPAFAFALSSATFLVSDAVLGTTDGAFLSYGWRIPFIASALMVAVGLYIRISIEETPAFRAEAERADRAEDVAGAKRPLPFVEVVRQQPLEILLSAGLMSVLFGFFYMGTAYLTAYGTTPEGAALDRQFVLSTGIVAALALGVATLAGGVWSDRVGRRPVIITSGVLALAWSLVLFPLLDTDTPLAFAAGVVVTLAIFGLAFGPVGAYLPELFETRFRYTGAGAGYNLGGVLGGAVPPLLAPGLTASYGSIAVGVMLALLAVLSIACTVALRGRTRMAVAG
ncbi:MFS family permease [Nocardioides zeae]|uniref:MFS family permease n=1 Tax=Nocardioides zeae TaxID=1457234 RepID=A0ACC6IK52_9ACTN|nr:MFS transporter [Nocardioides zeae]MDR6173570.1 MFS family permease [Nocardioides zeae]MDR6210975.1 MFS family permease [Nocardioides zeae]